MEPPSAGGDRCFARQLVGGSGPWHRTHELGAGTMLGPEEAFPPHLKMNLGGEQTKDKWPYTLVSHVVDSGTGRGATS